MGPKKKPFTMWLKENMVEVAARDPDVFLVQEVSDYWIKQVLKALYEAVPDRRYHWYHFNKKAILAKDFWLGWGERRAVGERCIQFVCVCVCVW